MRVVDEYRRGARSSDELEATVKRYGESGRLIEAKGWGEDFAERLKTDEGFQAYQKGEVSRVKMGVAGMSAQKAIHLTGDSLTGEVIAPARIEGVVAAPNRPVHIRQFIAEGQTTSSSIRIVTERLTRSAFGRPSGFGIGMPCSAKNSAAGRNCLISSSVSGAASS